MVTVREIKIGIPTVTTVIMLATSIEKTKGEMTKMLEYGELDVTKRETGVEDGTERVIRRVRGMKGCGKREGTMEN